MSASTVNLHTSSEAQGKDKDANACMSKNSEENDVDVHDVDVHDVNNGAAEASQEAAPQLSLPERIHTITPRCNS